MKNLSSLLSIILVSFFLSCSEDTSLEVSPDTIEASKSKEAFDKVMGARGTTEGSDPFEILEATVSNELLRVTVQYSGGCEVHQFEAFWSGGFYPTAAPPPLAPVVISHQGNNDPCDGLITETLKIDVKKLFGADYSTDKFIPILLNGSSTQEVIAEPEGNCTTTGTVIVESDLDGCAIFINLDDGTRIEPVEVLDEGFSFEHLQRVSFSYTPLDQASICMVGQTARIDCIEAIGYASYRGTVKDYSDLDGCGFVIELASGATLEPHEVMVPNFTLKDQQEVWLSYVPLNDVGSVCMAGTPVRITGIKEVE